MHPEIKRVIESMKKGVLVLTVNKRLSRHLLLQYEKEMVKAGRLAWETPLIMPFSSWVESLWGEYGAAPFFSDVRSYALWARLAEEDARASGLVMRKGIAAESYEARAIVKEYGISLPDDIYLTEEARFLKKWTLAYDRELSSRGYVDRAGLAAGAARLINGKKAVLPLEIILAGFDEYRPDLALVSGALKATGSSVGFWPEEPPAAGDEIEVGFNGRVHVRPCADELEEVVDAARWCRSVIRPDIRIAVIAPNLGRYRGLIEKEFRAELTPSLVFPWEAGEDAFNISLGEPLADCPIINAALAVLSIPPPNPPLARGGVRGCVDAVQLLRAVLSPYMLCSQAEFIAMSRLDKEIKEKNLVKASLLDLKAMLPPQSPPYTRGGLGGVASLEGFGKRLALWIDSLAAGPEKRLPSAWATHFISLIHGLGFMRPLGQALTSAEYQALEAWKDLLEGFSSLDDLLGRITREDSVRKIRDMASSTLHQKEAGERPVEALGILESSGMFFDKVWLMGCDEEALPPQPSPNPFIPLSLLQRHGVRLSTHERAGLFAKTALRRMFKSAPCVEASYPLSRDEKKLCLSPLLKGLGEPSPIPPLGSASVKTALAANVDIEPRLVEARLEVSPVELKTMSGGTAILKDQSACPFRAFARYRLRASGLKTTEFGLRAYERGTVVHDALKWFWENVRDSAKLRDIAEKGKLAAYAQRAADEALKDFSAAKDEDRQYIDLESKRVSEVVLEWLNFELERPDFSVREIEERKEVNVGGLSIFARIDRVDETAGGERVVIDYKTGKCSKDYWLPGRPKEPQLLVYGLSGQFDAVAFASLKLKDARFVGLSKDGNALPGIGAFDGEKWRLKIQGVEDWDGLRAKWRETLIALAKDFLSGDADVDPNPGLKGLDQPCAICDIRPLCRIFEREDMAGDEDEEDRDE